MNNIESIPDLLDEISTWVFRWRIVALVATFASALLAWIIYPMFELEPGIYALAGIAVVLAVGIFMLDRHIRRVSGAKIMPILCSYLGDFTYRRDSGFPQEFLNWGIIPKGASREAEDYVAGTFAEARFWMWDAQTRSGGKRQSILFKGLLLKVDQLDPKHRFILAKSQGPVSAFFGSFFGNAPSPSTADRQIRMGQQVFDLYLTHGILDIDKLVAQIEELHRKMPPNAAFQGMAQANGDAFIAIHTFFNPFDIASLLVGRAQLETRVDHALSLLKTPAEIALHWTIAQQHFQKKT